MGLLLSCEEKMGIPQQEAKNLEKNQEPVLLRMEGIVKEFPGVKALDGVNLTVRAGTVHALMGEETARVSLH